MIDKKEARNFIRYCRENGHQIHPDNEKLLYALAGMCSVCSRTRDLQVAYDKMMCDDCKRNYKMKKGGYVVSKEQAEKDNVRLLGADK